MIILSFLLHKYFSLISPLVYIYVSSQILFMDLNILPLYNLTQHRLSFMMYKLVNGLLPEVMNELYTTNDQIILQDNIVISLLTKEVPLFTQQALVI